MKVIDMLLAAAASCLSIAAAYPHAHFGNIRVPEFAPQGLPYGDVDWIVKPWVPPTIDDCRSPCPALNTLANHGFIEHNGRDIDQDSVVEAIIAAFNFDPDFATSFVDGAFQAAGIPQGGPLGLGELTGTPLDHPASLFHNDNLVFVDVDASTNETLVWEMLADTRPLEYPYLNASSIARTHARRVRESVADGFPPPSAVQEGQELGECALILLVFGQTGVDGVVDDVESRRVPKAWAEDWFVLNRIPDEFRRSSRTWTAADQAVLAAAVQREGEQHETDPQRPR